MQISPQLQQAMAEYDRGNYPEVARLAAGVSEADAAYFVALNLLGMALHEQGQSEAAIEHLNRSVALRPDYAGAHNNLAAIHVDQRRFDQALPCIDRAIALKPDVAEYQETRGMILLELRRFPEAIETLQQAAARDPRRAELHRGLGLAYAELGQWTEAQHAVERALAVDPDSAAAHSDHGRVLTTLARYDEALAALDRALQREPEVAATWLRRGNALGPLQRHDEAMAAYDRALALDPGLAEAAFNKSLVLLRCGRYGDGLRLYEQRFARRDAPARAAFGRPIWLGDGDIAGKRILIEFEQGLGDAVSMLRYVPLLEQRGATCLLQLPPPLATLAQRSFPKARVMTEPGLAQIDLVTPIMSLPLALGTMREVDVPAPHTYLRADPQRVMAWRVRLDADHRRRVGLAWRGNPNQVNDRNRSMPLAALTPLLARNDIHVVTLQKDLTAEERSLLAGCNNVTMVDTELQSLDDTAAVMSVLDVMISVCSSPAHLAGALGRPTWIMLAYTPDWRWSLGRTDSTWYPTARLFRQRAIGDWSSVVESIDAALERPVRG